MFNFCQDLLYNFNRLIQYFHGLIGLTSIVRFILPRDMTALLDSLIVAGII